MPESSIENQIANAVQHYVYRGETYENPSAKPQPLPDTSLLLKQLQAAGNEQARGGFAFSPESSEWVRSVSGLIYAALEEVRRQSSSADTQKALMHAINCLDAFEKVQEIVRNDQRA